MYYYSMSVPEIITLMFVLFLWVLSIFFCFKRYEKINTIERGDVPSSLMNANFQRKASFGTTASTVSLKNLNNGGQANVAACLVDANGSGGDMMLDSSSNKQLLLNPDGSSLTRMMHFSDVVSLSNYQQRRRVSGPDSYNYFNNSNNPDLSSSSNEKTSSGLSTSGGGSGTNPVVAATTTANSVVMAPNKNLRYFKQMHMGKYAKRFTPMMVKLDSTATNNNSINGSSHEFQMCNSNNNLARLVVDPFLNYRLQAVSKSSSVPNFKSENSNKPICSQQPLNHEHMNQLNERDTSSEFVTVTLPESDSFSNNNNNNNNNNPSTMFSSTMTNNTNPMMNYTTTTVNLNTNPTTTTPRSNNIEHHYHRRTPPLHHHHAHSESQHTHHPKSEQLLDPRLIPMSVRKSLIGLHQKSMLNLLNKSTMGLNEDSASATAVPVPSSPLSTNLAPSSQNIFASPPGSKNNLLKKYSRNQASLYDLSKTSHLRV